MQILTYILKTDYILSQWFSKTKDKVVPGTAFIFLNKLAFFWLGLYLIVMSVTKIELNSTISASVVVTGGVLIMYGLQKSVEKYVIKLDLHQEYSNYTNKELRYKRMAGLFLFIFSLSFIFIVMIIFS